MSGEGKLRDWSKGANNLAPKNAVPAGFVRHAVNVDASPTGLLTMSAGSEQIYAGTDVRGVLALKNKLLAADGASLILIDAATGASSAIRTIAASGPFVGAVMNDRLYFCTQTECLEFDGQSVRPWGVPDVTNQPSVVDGAGAMAAGAYQIALTYTDQWGREGGTDKPTVHQCAAGTGLVVHVTHIPAGCTANVYVSPVNGSELYLQANINTAQSVAISTVRDDTLSCASVLLRAPRPASRMAVHAGILLLAVNNVLEVTRPMQTHLLDRVRGFFQYPTLIGEVMSDGVTAFVSADKCYALTDLETSSVQQDVVLEFPAIAGTAVTLVDGRVGWMTRYGQALGKSAINARTILELVNKDAYVPSRATEGAAALLDCNGNQMIVTTTRGKHTGNPLAASDFYIGEILNP